MTQILRFSPDFFREFLARVFGVLWFYFAGEKRRIIKENLITVLGRADMKDVKKVFVNFMRVYGDILNIPNMSKSYIQSMIKVKGILVSPHVGGMELAGIYLTSLGLPLYSVAETQGPGMDFFKFYNRYRGHFGNRLLPLEDRKLPFKLIRALKKNKIIVLIGDRDILNSGATIEFFGRKASIPKGIAFLSRKTGAPILVGLLGFSSGSRRYSGILFEPIYPEEFDSNDELLKEVVRLMEKGIRIYPFQWFVFQRIWE
ncbi:MAG: lysophospholipid acyltransferase family protein [candidate division WOR-3 bacterium]